MDIVCKVYLTTVTEPKTVEIRKIRFDPSSMTLEDLHSKLRSMFKRLKDVPFTVYWLDSDNEQIAMSSDEELQLFASDSARRCTKLYIKLDTEIIPAGSKMQHPGVICDACDNPIIGFRYKCIECDDYDLCSTCEAMQHHSHHCMIRMPQPLKWSCRHGRRLSYHMKKFLRKNAFFNTDEGEHEGQYSHEKHHDKSMPHCKGPSNTKSDYQSGCDHTIPINFDSLAKYFNAWTGLVTDCPMMSTTAKQTEGSSAKMEADSHAKEKENDDVIVFNINKNDISGLLRPFGFDVNFATKTCNNSNEPSTNVAPMDVDSEEITPTPETSAKKFPGEGRKLIEKRVQNDNISDSNVASSSDQGSPLIKADAPVPSSSNVPDGWTLLNRSESPATSRTRSSSSVSEKSTKEAMPTTVNNVSPAKETLYPQLAEEQKVFHPNPKIQHAVETMMAMGFSNEGGWLTLLLDAKDGNISKVLDILQPVRQG